MENDREAVPPGQTMFALTVREDVRTPLDECSEDEISSSSSEDASTESPAAHKEELTPEERAAQRQAHRDKLREHARVCKFKKKPIRYKCRHDPRHSTNMWGLFFF